MRISAAFILAFALTACGFNPCAPESQALNVVAPGVGVALVHECDALRGDKATGDLDGDGVADSADACPQTPRGENPDAKRPGCPETTAGPLAFADPSYVGFALVRGVSWHSFADWDAKTGQATTATLEYAARVDPALQHTLALQVSTVADLNTGANITDCQPPAQDFVNGHCVRRDLRVQVRAAGLVLYEAELTASAAEWKPLLPAIVLPIGAEAVVVKFSAVGSVFITPTVVAGQDTAAAVR